MEEKKIIRPQKGYQENVLSCPADIVIGGGTAGAGKTFSLLLDPMRGFELNGFEAVIFRRTTKQISGGGGLWDESINLYSNYKGAIPVESRYKWNFESGAKLQFSHMEHEKNKLDHQGLQYAFIGFDELTHFTKSQFFYLLTRNRSVSGVKPYIRCTCNPDPESWVAEFIEWYLDEEGYIIPERDGIIRYFTIDKDNVIWGDTKEEVLKKCPHKFEPLIEKGEDVNFYIKSFTFIEGNLDENKELLKKDPTYKANLMTQDEATRKALLDRCWKPVQDNMAIVDYKMLSGFEKNYPKTTEGDYISVDVAGYGKDLAVIKRFKGWFIAEVRVFTKSGPELLTNNIEEIRNINNIPVGNVIYDNDGMGWGLSDNGYVCFNGGAGIVEVNGIKENYKNLKTQLYYHVIEDNFNKGDIGIDEDNIFVDGERTKTIKIKTKVYSIVQLIKNDIRAIKRDKIDIEGKRQINSKAEQKNILGRSPDFGDTIMQRKYFDFLGKSSFIDFNNI